ncbi:MAG: helix-turn-helix domain-containing protein [Methylocella sp.]
MRARIVLGAAAGKSNSAPAKELKTSRPTLIDWRARFAEGGVKALYEARPRGRSFKPLVRAKEAEVIARTQTAPPQVTQWICRRMAKIRGISQNLQHQQSIGATHLANEWLETPFGQDLQAVQRP